MAREPKHIRINLSTIEPEDLREVHYVRVPKTYDEAGQITEWKWQRKLAFAAYNPDGTVKRGQKLYLEQDDCAAPPLDAADQAAVLGQVATAMQGTLADGLAPTIVEI